MLENLKIRKTLENSFKLNVVEVHDLKYSKNHLTANLN